MEFKNTTLEDLPKVFELYQSAVDYQRSKGYNLWPAFKEQMIRNEIEEKRHWKIF